MSRITTAVRLAAALCIAITASSVRAQDSTAAPPLQTLLSNGRSVRLHLYDGRTVRGDVVATTDSTVLLTPCAACARGTFRMVDVSGVDTLIGRSSRGKHVFVGALLGGIAAVGALGIAASQQDRGCHDGPCGLWVLAIPPAFAVGLVTGGVTGAFLPAERWSPTTFTYDGETIRPTT